MGLVSGYTHYKVIKPRSDSCPVFMVSPWSRLPLCAVPTHAARHQGKPYPQGSSEGGAGEWSLWRVGLKAVFYGGRGPWRITHSAMNPNSTHAHQPCTHTTAMSAGLGNMKSLSPQSPPSCPTPPHTDTFLTFVYSGSFMHYHGDYIRGVIYPCVNTIPDVTFVKDDIRTIHSTCILFL